MTGLIRRDGRYSVRRVIPFDLQNHFGRREIVKALGTADPKEARRLHALAWVKLDQEFARAREELAGNTIPEPTPRTGPQTISDAEFEWLMDQFEFQNQQALEDDAAVEKMDQLERRLLDPKADLGETELAMRNLLKNEQEWRKIERERLAFSKAAPVAEKRPKKGHNLGNTSTLADALRAGHLDLAQGNRRRRGSGFIVV